MHLSVRKNNSRIRWLFSDCVQSTRFNELFLPCLQTCAVKFQHILLFGFTNVRLLEPCISLWETRNRETECIFGPQLSLISKRSSNSWQENLHVKRSYLQPLVMTRVEKSVSIFLASLFAALCPSPLGVIRLCIQNIVNCLLILSFFSILSPSSRGRGSSVSWTVTFHRNMVQCFLVVWLF